MVVSPTRSVSLSIPDQQLIQTLVEKVRVVSSRQVATILAAAPDEPSRQTTQQIRKLLAAGLIQRATMAAQEPPPLAEPLYHWTPGSAEPDCHAIAATAFRRWQGPCKPTTVFSATPQCVNLFSGTGGRLPRVSELSHDLGLTSLYLHFCRLEPNRARNWISEASLYALGWGKNAKLPDALITGADKPLAIELVGVYTHKKLGAFHRFCMDASLSYELW